MNLQDFYLGIKVTLIGMGVVFAGLYALQLVMYGMKGLFYKEPPKQATPVAATPAPLVEAIEPEQAGLPTAVVAAIAVAVAACLGCRTGNIVAIRKTGEGKSPWQHAARVAPFANRRS